MRHGLVAGPLPVEPAERAAQLWERVVLAGEVAGERGVERVVALLPRSDLRLMVIAHGLHEARGGRGG